MTLNVDVDSVGRTTTSDAALGPDHELHLRWSADDLGPLNLDHVPALVTRVQSLALVDWSRTGSVHLVAVWLADGARTQQLWRPGRLDLLELHRPPLDGPLVATVRIAHPLRPADASALQERVSKAVLDGEGLRLTLRGPAAELAACAEAFEEDVPGAQQQVALAASPDVLPAAAGPDLSRRQREVLERAVEFGYYELPRRISIEELASHMGLSRSTVSEHLQRGEAVLLAGWYARQSDVA